MKLYTLFSKIQGAFYRQIEKIEDAFLNFRLRFSSYSKKTKASFLLMGLGQILYKQYIKGILYMLSEIAFILFFALKGGKMIAGFITLGTQEADPWLGVQGDNSVIMMILGIVIWASRRKK